MNFTYRSTSLLILVLAVFSWTACDVGESGSDDGPDFDREAMLANFGENIIIPSYDALVDSLNEMATAADNFSADPSTATLQQLQSTLKSSRLAWQRVNLFNFGPASNNLLRTSLNTYPTDTARIEENIDSGDYTLGTVSNQDAVGFPALGYLLHGIGANNQEIVSAYTDDPDASERMQYLEDNVDFIQQKASTVAQEWSADQEDYLTMFLSQDNLGTDAGSSLSMLINAYIQHYERYIRDGKIGIPSGVRSAGVARPQATEAYYAGYSKELALANLQAVQRVFKGITFPDGMNNRGLSDNLEAHDETELVDEIESNMDDAISSVQALNDPLSQQVQNNNDKVQSAFQDLQAVVGPLKTDMTSVLGITITYQDQDGD